MFKRNANVSKYYKNWINLYKRGCVRDVTLKKYENTCNFLTKLEPNLTFGKLNRNKYQEIINEFAKTHEKQTVIDFHHQLKSALIDALDEGYLKQDPTRKVIIKGKIPSSKKCKYLSYFELKKVMQDLKIEGDLNYDYLILLLAKTGVRFSEALGLTKEDFDFEKHTIKVNKTWDYKNGGGFVYTKNESSIRTVDIDEKLTKQFKTVVEKLQPDVPVFLRNKKNIYNSTINDILKRHCKNANVPVISAHALRHTHASVLLYKGVSVASISKRLGHANTTITEKVYLDVIDELRNKDKNIIIDSLNEL